MAWFHPGCSLGDVFHHNRRSETSKHARRGSVHRIGGCMAWNLVPKAEWLETEEQVREAAAYLAQSAPNTGLGVDTETTGLDTKTDIPILMSLSDGHRR